MILMTKKRSLTPYLFLAPALLVIAIFVLYPIVAVVYYSFTDYSIVTPPVWIGKPSRSKTGNFTSEKSKA